MILKKDDICYITYEWETELALRRLFMEGTTDIRQNLIDSYHIYKNNNVTERDGNIYFIQIKIGFKSASMLKTKFIRIMNDILNPRSMYPHFSKQEIQYLKNDIDSLTKVFDASKRSISSYFTYKHSGGSIEKVIFNKPATIVIWKDGSKTIVKCKKGEKYDKEKGLAMCIAKKELGNTGAYYDVFKKYLKEEK